MTSAFDEWAAKQSGGDAAPTSSSGKFDDWAAKNKPEPEPPPAPEKPGLLARAKGAAMGLADAVTPANAPVAHPDAPGYRPQGLSAAKPAGMVESTAGAGRGNVVERPGERAAYSSGRQPYADKREAINDAADLIEGGADPRKVFENFARIGVSQDEIIARGRELGGPAFTPDTRPVTVRPGAMDGEMSRRDPGTLESLGNFATRAGQTIGRNTDVLANEAGVMGNDTLAGRFAQRTRRIEAAAPSLENTEGQQAISQAGEQGFMPALRAMRDNPVSFFTMLADSMAQSLPTSIVAGGLGFAAGGPLGAAGGAFAGSGATEYASALVDAISAGGRDPRNPQDVLAALNDPKLMADARKRGAIRGVTVGAFDALSAGIAGKFMLPVVNAIESGALKGGRAALAAGTASAKETGAQAGLGMAGEAAGAVAAGDKINAADVVMEGLAEVPGGIPEAAGNIAHSRKKDARTRAAEAGDVEQALLLAIEATPYGKAAAKGMRFDPPLATEPPETQRAKTEGVFRGIAAAYGMSKKAAEAALAKAETVPLASLGGYLARVTDSFGRRGLMGAPADPDALGALAHGPVRVEPTMQALPAADLVPESDGTGLDEAPTNEAPNAGNADRNGGQQPADAGRGDGVGGVPDNRPGDVLASPASTAGQGLDGAGAAGSGAERADALSTTPAGSGMFLVVGGKRYPVGSYKEASEMARSAAKAAKERNGGEGVFIGNLPIEDAQGRVIAHRGVADKIVAGPPVLDGDPPREKVLYDPVDAIRAGIKAKNDARTVDAEPVAPKLPAPGTAVADPKASAPYYVMQPGRTGKRIPVPSPEAAADALGEFVRRTGAEPVDGSIDVYDATTGLPAFNIKPDGTVKKVETADEARERSRRMVQEAARTVEPAPAAPASAAPTQGVSDESQGQGQGRRQEGLLTAGAEQSAPLQAGDTVTLQGKTYRVASINTLAVKLDDGAGQQRNIPVGGKVWGQIERATGNPMLDNPASWVIREKATGKVVMETFDRAKVDALNTAKHEAVPAAKYLGELNGKPTQEPNEAARPQPEAPRSEAPAATAEPAAAGVPAAAPASVEGGGVDRQALEEKRQMVADMIATKKANREAVPDAWTKRLAELSAQLRGETVDEGAVYSLEVEGHPMYDGRPVLRNLVPIKVSSVADAQRKLDNANTLEGKVAKEFYAAQYELKQAKTAGQKKAAKARLDKLTNQGWDEDALKALRDTTIAELSRLHDAAVERFGATINATAPVESPSGSAAGEPAAVAPAERTIGTHGRTPKAVETLTLKPNADGTLTPYSGKYAMVDFESGAEIVLPGDVTDTDAILAIRKAGALTAKDKVFRKGAAAEAAAEPAPEPAPTETERYEAGRALTKEQRKQVLDSLVDVYKAKGAPREQKGIGRDGNERYGYVHSPELFEKSDITGAMVRYYVTLPDKRIAHPTELFPDYTQADVDAALAKREADEKADRENQAGAEARADKFAAPTAVAAEASWKERNKGMAGADPLRDWRTGQQYTLVTMEKGGKFYSARNDDAALIGRLERGGWKRIGAPAAPPAPLYASRPVLNAEAIMAWAASQGFTSTLPFKDLHVTVAYSRDPVDGAKAGPTANTLTVNGGKRTVEPLGDEGAIVLKFASPDMQARWKQYRDAGASWDYESYTPHVTITYDGKGVDLSKVTPYAGPIELGAEKQEPLNVDKAADYKEAGEAPAAPVEAPAVQATKPKTAKEAPPPDLSTRAGMVKALKKLGYEAIDLDAARTRIPNWGRVGVKLNTIPFKLDMVVELKNERWQFSALESEDPQSISQQEEIAKFKADFAKLTEPAKRAAQAFAPLPAAAPEPTPAPAWKPNATAATHKDPGEPAEPVTPAVVREAIKTGVKDTGRKPSEMQAELLAKIDAAVQEAPDYGDFQAAIKTMGLKEATEAFTGRAGLGEKAAPQGYSRPTRMFHVKGDGIFTIQNTVRQLLTFREKVESSPGFRDRQAPTGLTEKATTALDRRSTDAAIANMVDEGDFQAALDYAEAKDVDIANVKLTKVLRDRLDKWQKNRESDRRMAEYKANNPAPEPAPQPEPAAEPEAEDIPEAGIASQTFDQWVRAKYNGNEYKAKYLEEFNGDEKRAILGAAAGTIDNDQTTAVLLKTAKQEYRSELFKLPRETSISLEVWGDLSDMLKVEAQRHFYDLDRRITRRDQDTYAAKAKAEREKKAPYEAAFAEVDAEIRRLDKIPGPETQKQKDLSGRRDRLREAIYQIGQGKEPDGRLLRKEEDPAAPAAASAMTGPRRDPEKVSMFNPYLSGDIVTIGGKDWMVKQDMPGWYLSGDGTWREQHPTINGIKAMMDLIREVEQAAQAPIATPDDITAGAKTPEVAAVVELRKQLAVLKALKDCLAS